MRQPYRATAIAGGAALVVVLSVVVGSDVAYRDVALRVSLELSVAVVSLLAGVLALRRFAERGRLGELVLGVALAALALACAAAAALPVLVAEESAWPLGWMRFPPLLLAAAALAASPFLLGRTVVPRRAHVAAALGVVVTIQAVSGLAVYAVGGRLPAELAQRVATGTYDWPRDAHPMLLFGHALVVGFFALAAFGFSREADRAGDRLVEWIGFGCGLAAVAHLGYALYPSLYSDAVSIGDAFRLAFCACVLVGTVREVSDVQRALTDAAVTGERRRLARELHDGLAQELSLLVTQSRLLARRYGELDGVEALERTSVRALDESRFAIRTLTRPGTEPLDVVLETVVADLADRMGTNVRLRLTPGVDVEPFLRDALVRIVQEAMANAVRHGHATSVSVELENGDGLRLRVVDDGWGFSPERASRHGSGFGLVSMRERAEALGGRLTIASRPGEGTRVELVLP